MSNKIVELEADLKKKAEEESAAYQENFDKSMDLSEEDKQKLAELETETQMVITETAPDGSSTSTPINEYASPLDTRVAEIGAVSNEASELLKTVNSGDIRKTVEDAKAEARANAITAFRQLSVGTQDLTDDQIVEINNAGLAAVQQYLKTDRISSDEVIKKLHKLSLRDFQKFLPEEFMSIYVNSSEIAANNFKAKERLLSSIAYLTVTGPEMDYLNEYIDNEHRLMAVSRQLMQCQVDFVEMLKDPKKMSEIAAAAAVIEAPDDTIWSKYIKTDPKRVHNEFAQRAVICSEYKQAYQKVLEEHQNEPDAVKIIQEQIDECDAKYAVYTSVTNLDLMKDLWQIMVDRFKGGKNSYKNLVREAVSALDRIRRSKQDVPFPVYDEKLAKRPEELFNLYMKQFPVMIKRYNSAVMQVRNHEPDKTAETNIEMIALEGKFEDTVASYYALLLLILFGRIMKKLTDNNMTKYDAIMLDAYFQCYCKMGSDIYLMTDIWNITKDFVAYAIETWPATKR